MTRTRLVHGGFTLIELLVVIAITTMLISLVLPSMSKARDSAKDTQCLNRLRSLVVAQTIYLHDYERFQPLNNDPDDGFWQYNYVIYDGRDYESGFGPLVEDGHIIQDVNVLFCPVQKDPYHSLSTPQNPYPVVPSMDWRAAYARRYHLTGKRLSEMRGTPAIFADVFHLPKVVKSAHKDGVNAAYLDGHARWVKDKNNILTHNEFAHPFDAKDNDLVEDIWDFLNHAK